MEAAFKNVERPTKQMLNKTLFPKKVVDVRSTVHIEHKKFIY